MGASPEADAARIFGHTDMSGDCWLWQRKLSYDGYARASVGSRKVGNYRTGVAVHRWVYEYIVGPIPEGLAIDHRCGVRNCLNPAHMEPVDPRINTARMFRKREPQTYCAKGIHLMEAHAVYTSSGKRYCGPCVTTAKRERKATRKAAVA